MCQTSFQKHLCFILDSRLLFEDYFKTALDKMSKTLGLLRKLQNILTGKAVLALYKSFITPHLDYVDMIYDIA